MILVVDFSMITISFYACLGKVIVAAAYAIKHD